MSVGPPGSLFYDASDPGQQDGTANEPKTNCSGDLYRLGRLTGRVTDIRHDASHTFGPLAAAHDGSYAVSTQNCPETDHQLIVMAHGKLIAAPARVVGNDPEPLDWSRNSRELLVLSQPGVRLLRLTGAGLKVERILSSTQRRHCSLDTAVFDAFGVLEIPRCPVHGRDREQLVQLRGIGSHVLWRDNTPLNGAGVDTDVTSRSVVLTGECHAQCGEGSPTMAVLIGQLSRRGVALRPVPIGRRFVTGATF
jgi:hypothetical protein